MNLRTKLVFALVAVSLASMLALSAVAYMMASEFLTAKSLRQLDSLAEAKKEELEKVIDGWQDRVLLVASRTQLRLSLQDFNETGDLEQQELMERILSDALEASRALLSLTVYDIEGRAVAAAGLDGAVGLPELETSRPTGPGEKIAFQEVSFTTGGEPQASFITSLTLDDRRIGALHVVLYAQELIDVTQNFIGQGDTGETMIVLPDSSGVAHVLHPVRQRANERPGLVSPSGPSDPAARALRGVQGPFMDGVDYRGEAVWAATRLLSELGWGVVVKADEAEERAPILEFRGQLARLGISLSAFAILLGTFLGLRFAKPIHNLAGVANRIRLGELDARAKVIREDELGLLARTFNQMAEELERQVTLLHEYQKFFEVSLDMLCIAGTDGYFKRVNPAFERTLGWSTDQLLSRPFVEFVHPRDVEATLYEIEKLSQGIPTVSFENCYLCADGSYKQLLWKSYPDPETGLIYAIARDITDLKELQKRQQSQNESDSRGDA